MRASGRADGRGGGLATRPLRRLLLHSLRLLGVASTTSYVPAATNATRMQYVDVYQGTQNDVTVTR